ncbi:MAG: DUF4363 family protein [Oscillospiraceae bacterium]|jgi:hypothetical protein|nr:DUF4363 family protein [Oscillospiraceae bacterium]
MKRFIAALVVLSLTVACAVTTQFLVLRKVDTLQEEARELVTLSAEEDPQALRAALTKLEHSWDKADRLLHMFVVHRELGEVELTLPAMDEYLQNGDEELFRESSVRLLEALEHIGHSTKINLGNIF